MVKYKEIKAIAAYVLLFAAVIAAVRIFFYHELLNSSNFLFWDAEHYQWIKEKGYEGYRIAFFPLFPLIWRWLSVGVYGIVVVNGIVFLSAFYLMAKDLKLSVTEILVYLSIPGFIFFFLPFSESFFFLISAVLLYGLKYNKVYFVCAALLLSAMSRPAFTIFIPAILITELLSSNRTNLLQRLGLYLACFSAGILFVGIVQYMDTGEWFRFFAVQKGWGNALQWPKLPLTSWAGGFVVRLDGVAFFVGILAGAFLTAVLLKLKFIRNITVPAEVIFSLAYLGGITLSVLIFRGGSLFSLNRFIFATPFIVVVFDFWIKQAFYPGRKQLLYIFGGILLFWLLFGSYVHIQAFLKFLLLTLYVFLLFVMKSDQPVLRKTATGLLILVNLIFQVILYVRFLNGGWVG